MLYVIVYGYLQDKDPLRLFSIRVGDIPDLRLLPHPELANMQKGDINFKKITKPQQTSQAMVFGFKNALNSG